MLESRGLSAYRYFIESKLLQSLNSEGVEGFPMKPQKRGTAGQHPEKGEGSFDSDSGVVLHLPEEDQMFFMYCYKMCKIYDVSKVVDIIKI